MAWHFPIFIDFGGTLPLVVGAQPALSAKLRLLTGFAPRVELLTGLQKVPLGLGLPGVHHIDGISLDQADYLRRCSFSHLEIAPGALAQCQRSLSLSPPPMQQMLSGRRSRNRDMATS